MIDGRNELRSMICKYGKPIVWFTICPSQQFNPLVLKLGNISDELLTTVRDRVSFCMKDPVACVEFFHLTVREVLKILRLEIGMDQYYGVIEAQMRGTLHLHLLGWNTGHQFNSDEDWIRFADKVSSATVDLETSLTEEDINALLEQFPEKITCESDIINSSRILSLSTMTNLHDYRHRKSCFKTTSGGRTGVCRYKFPKVLNESTQMKDDGIELKRNHEYVNPYNALVMCTARCNHDIRVLPNIPGDDVLALLYYLTNYTTKMESSNYSVCDVAATARKELLHELKDPNDRQYADRLFIRILNKITGKNEISSNLVVNELLRYDEDYCSQKFKPLNYGIFLRALAGEDFDVHVRLPQTAPKGVAVHDLEEEHLIDEIVVTSLYDDYTNRGDRLASLSVYQYVERVYKQKLDKKKSPPVSCYRFDAGHAQSLSHVQMLLRDADNLKVPKLIGPATNKFSEKEYVNLLVILFKPWKDIEDVVKFGFENIDEFCSSFDDTDENLRMAQNFLLLQKSKFAADRMRERRKENNAKACEDGELLVGGGYNVETDDVSEEEDDSNQLEEEDQFEDLLMDMVEVPMQKRSEKVYVNMVKNLGKFLEFDMPRLRLFKL